MISCKDERLFAPTYTLTSLLPACEKRPKLNHLSRWIEEPISKFEGVA